MDEIKEIIKNMKNSKDDCIASQVGYILGTLKGKEFLKETFSQAQIIELLETVFD